MALARLPWMSQPIDGYMASTSYRSSWLRNNNVPFDSFLVMFRSRPEWTMIPSPGDGAKFPTFVTNTRMSFV